MNLRSLIVLAFGILVMTNGLFSQFGLHVGHLDKNILSQRYQPANILSMDHSKFSYSADAGIWLANSAFTLQGFLAEGGTLTQETRERYVEKAENGAVARLGYNLGLININVDIKGHPWAFFLNQALSMNAGFTKGGTLGLVLLGNKPYAGQTVSDDGVYGNYIKYRELGAGSAWQFGDLRIGGRIKFLQGSKMLNLSKSSYSVYTDPDGTEVDVVADYNLVKTQEFGKLKHPFVFQGFGGALDLGLTYDLNEKMKVGLSLLDWGGTLWTDVQKLESSIDVEWEGIPVSNLFASDLDEEMQGVVDSIVELIFPDTTIGNYFLPSAGLIRADLEVWLTDKDMISPTLIYSPFRLGSFTRYPLLNFVYHRKITDYLTLGANIYGGGTNLYGFGLMGDLHLPVAEVVEINLTLVSDDLLGLIIPSIGRGASISGGLGFTLLK